MANRWLCNVGIEEQMSESRRREDIVIYIDCDVVVQYVGPVNFNPIQINCITMLIIFQMRCAHCRGKALMYKAVNHKDYDGAFGQRQPQGHTCCNIFKNLCPTLFLCWTVTWPASSNMWPFLTMRSRLCKRRISNWPHVLHRTWRNQKLSSLRRTGCQL